MSQIKNNYVVVNRFSRPGLKRSMTKGIIVHYTANPGASAANHASFFDGKDGGGSRYASAHLFVDAKEALCIVPLNEVTYQANDVQKYVKGKAYRGAEDVLGQNANWTAVGVEMCLEKDGSIATATFNRTVDGVVELCKKYGLNQHDLYRHYDVTAKNCPAPFVARPSDWTRFKNEVARKLKGDTTSDKFYTYTPDRVVTLREIGLYEDVTLEKTIKRYPEGTRLTITGIEYDGKTPRLKTAKGYITANKKNVKGYHTSIGTIKVLVDDLNYYDTARWTNPDGQVNKGEVFTVVKKVGNMYLLKSGLYITASSQYVKFTAH